MTHGGASQLIAFLIGQEAVDCQWRKLVEAAGDTLTVGTLADRALARETELAIPQSIRDLFAEVRDRSWKRNALIRQQFAELLDALNSIGVEPVPMKGLARLLSSTPDDCRLLSDIDVMVPANRRNHCATAMRDLGYSPIEDPDPRAPMVFSRNRDVGSVDLHTQMRPYYLPLHYDRLASLCSRSDIGSGTVRMPSATCEAVLLIAHDQLHDGDYWRGLIDVRHLLDLREIASEGVDWTALADFFPSGSCRRAMEIGLRTASTFVGADVPEAYLGGSWARFQVKRRRLQGRFPALQPLLTLLTIAADPPQRTASGSPANPDSWRGTLRRRMATYLRPTNPGKISLDAGGQTGNSMREAIDVR